MLLLLLRVTDTPPALSFYLLLRNFALLKEQMVK